MRTARPIHAGRTHIRRASEWRSRDRRANHSSIRGGRGGCEWMDGWIDGWMDSSMHVCLPACVPMLALISIVCIGRIERTLEGLASLPWLGFTIDVVPWLVRRAPMALVHFSLCVLLALHRPSPAGLCLCPSLSNIYQFDTYAERRGTMASGSVFVSRSSIQTQSQKYKPQSLRRQGASSGIRNRQRRVLQGCRASQGREERMGAE